MSTQDLVVLTAETFDCAKSSNGGFSSAQSSLFGLRRQEKGWKERLIGTLASREVVDEFIALKDKHLNSENKKGTNRHPPNSVVLTAEIFDRAKSSNGGFSSAQSSLFGFRRQEKGWKERLVGTLASREVVAEFIVLKNKHLSSENQKGTNRHPPNSVVLTAEIFKRAKSSNGGFSNAQLVLLGLKKPVRGWRKILIGTRVARELVDEFIALKDKHLIGKREKKANQLPSFIDVDSTMPWGEQYKHPNWQKMKSYIFRRDNFKCQKCENDQRLLHVHHTKYTHKGFIWDVDPASLETLCDLCHSQRHGRDLTLH